MVLVEAEQRYGGPVAPARGDRRATVDAGAAGSDRFVLAPFLAELRSERQRDALADLEGISPDRAGRFRAAAEAAGVVSWSHFFPYLHFFGRFRKGQGLLHEFVGDSVLVYRVNVPDGRLALFLPPFPFDPGALEHARARMRAFNGDGQSRIVRIPEADALAVARAGFEIYHHSDEYIYDAAAVARLEGARFATVRRKLARYEADAAHVRPFRPDDQPSCRAMLDRWRGELAEQRVIIGPYYRYTRACLKNSSLFSADRLHGQVIEIDGEIAAFTFSGPITESHGSLFITVADRRFPGLAYFQRHRMIASMPGLSFFNDFSDSKRAGLAQMKRSFRPARMHSLFGARKG